MTVAGLGLAAVMSAPAHAGTQWESTREVGSGSGHHIAVSSDGTVAAWIRSKRITGSGPVRTAWRKGPQKGWTSSAPIPGTGRVKDLQLTSDGNTVLVRSKELGLLVAERESKNSWAPAQTIVPGEYIGAARMSADGNTVAWLDWADAAYTVPGRVMAAVREASGTWQQPVEVGRISYDMFARSTEAPIALSADGSTLVWINESDGLEAATKQTPGGWGSPVLLHQFPYAPFLTALGLSANGAVLITAQSDEGGLLSARRDAQGWAPTEAVTREPVTGAKVSPDGQSVAYSVFEDARLSVQRWTDSRWGEPVTLGRAVRSAIALTDSTIAWTPRDWKGSALRTSLYRRGAWQSAVKVSAAAQSPALTPDGTTLLWASTAGKRIYAVTR
jgi:hypothetical protein